MKKHPIKRVAFDEDVSLLEVTFVNSSEYTYPFEVTEIDEVISSLQEAENAADFQSLCDRLLTAKRLFDEGYALLKELR